MNAPSPHRQTAATPRTPADFLFRHRDGHLRSRHRLEKSPSRPRPAGGNRHRAAMVGTRPVRRAIVRLSGQDRQALGCGQARIRPSGPPQLLSGVLDFPAAARGGLYRDPARPRLCLLVARRRAASGLHAHGDEQLDPSHPLRHQARQPGLVHPRGRQHHRAGGRRQLRPGGNFLVLLQHRPGLLAGA